MPPDPPFQSIVDAAVTRLAREESGRVIALLAHRFGDVDLADEAVHEALISALESWPAQGVPDNPAAWLFAAGRNRAIDRMRRAASARRRTLKAAPGPHSAGFVAPDPARAADSAGDPMRDSAGNPELIVDESDVRDEHLRLALLCCHPALDRDTQITLTLRLVGGVATSEIAAAFLVAEETLAQRVVRAKRKIRNARIPLSIPAEVLLEDQDRTRWNLAQIDEANAVIGGALSRMTPGLFQVQALIAAQYANARRAADTDWTAIVRLYDQLEAMTGSPVVALNRAVAVAAADGPGAGLALLDELERRGDADLIDGYHLVHSTKGELLLRIGAVGPAIAAFERARGLARNPSELRHLERRLAEARARTAGQAVTP